MTPDQPTLPPEGPEEGPDAQQAPTLRSGGELAGSAGLVEALAEMPAEEVWLRGLKSERTRRAYRRDVREFAEVLGIRSREELYKVTPAAVLFWVAELEGRSVKSSTIRRKLSSLSSLFAHLITKAPKYVSAEERAILPSHNPVREIGRPSVDRSQGSTNILSQEEARKVLDAPPLSKEVKRGGKQSGKLETQALEGEILVRALRDRLILSIGFQTGARRAEIAHMTVGSIHHHDGYLCIRYVRKGGKEHRVPLHPETQVRLADYLEAAGHGDDKDGPLIRPTRRNQLDGTDDMRRHLEPNRIYQIVKRWVRVALGEGREVDYSPHSMRGTFITRAYENGCPRDRIQRDVGHAHASTTDLYIRAAEDLERSATFFANY